MPTPKKFTVRVKKAGNLGKGLFLTKGAIHRGDIVVEMVRPKYKTLDEWNGIRLDSSNVQIGRKTFPDDIGVHVNFRHQTYVFYDDALVKNAKTVRNQVVSDKNRAVPQWYRLNHALSPSLRVSKIGKTLDNMRIVWKANRDIKIPSRLKDVQLFFNYGEVPKSWNQV